MYSFLSSVCWKDYSFPIELSWHLVENQFIIDIRVYFCKFSSILLIFMSLHMLVLPSFDYCSFIVTFEMEKWTNLFVFFNIILAMSPLNFHLNFRISLSLSTKKPTDCIQSVDQLRESCHLSDIKSSDLGRGMSFRLFRSSLIPSNNNLQFSMYKSYTSFVKYIQKYFIFVTIFKCSFKFNFLECSLIAYRNTIDFCILVFNLAITSNQLRLFLNTTFSWNFSLTLLDWMR